MTEVAEGDHLGCALEAFELERVTRQGNDPLEFSTSKGIRTSLTTMYKDCSDENQAAASNALDWLFRRLRECPRNEDMFTSVQVGGADVLVGVTSRLYSIHFASTSVLTLTEDGESESSQICGLEALLAVGLNINPGIIPEIEQAKAEDRPLRLDCIPRISFGDARKSMRVGVYAVTKPPKTIFGQTTSLGFAARLGDKIYSSAQKVIAHLGDTDQRLGRTDHIVFPVDEQPWRERAWLSQALETLSIAMWGTTNDDVGMNSRIADDAFSHAALGPELMREVWQVARDASTQSPFPSSTYRPDRPACDNAVNWASRHVTPRLSDAVSPLTVATLVRNLYPLAATQLYPSFPPMGAGATVFLPPKLKGRKKRYLKAASRTTAQAGNRAQAPATAAIFNTPLSGLLQKVSSEISHAGLEGERMTRPAKQYAAKRVMKGFGRAG